MAKNLESIKFNYLKTTEFRVYHVDGGIGGVTPRKYINLMVYSERHVLPRIVEVSVKDGTLGDEVSREQRDGIIRDVHAALMMDVNAAISVRDWLTKQIESLQNLEKELSKGK